MDVGRRIRATAADPEMKAMEIETTGAGCSASRQFSADPAASRQVSADPDAAMKEKEIETDGASDSWKAMEMGMEKSSRQKKTIPI